MLLFVSLQLNTQKTYSCGTYVCTFSFTQLINTYKELFIGNFGHRGGPVMLGDCFSSTGTRKLDNVHLELLLKAGAFKSQLSPKFTNPTGLKGKLG